MLTLTTLALLALAPQEPDYRWSGPLAAGREVRIKNLSGAITVEPASGGQVEVTAVKRAGRRGSPDAVTIRRVETGRGLEFCAIYPGMDAGDEGCEWEHRDRGRRDDRDRNDTQVHFTVRLPRGVALDANTVSGDILARGLRAPVEARTVSGSVRLADVVADLVEAASVSGDVRLEEVEAGEVEAASVSGDVEFLGRLRRDGRYEFTTVSGDVDLGLPPGTGAEVEATTMSGDIASGFPLTGTGTRERRAMRNRLRGTIGEGGATIRLQTLSGDVAIRERPGR